MKPNLPNDLEASILRALSERCGRRVAIDEVRPVTGGCIHQSVRLSTNLRESFFLKWSLDAGEGMFPAEAEGLRTLAGAGDIDVPGVIACSRATERPGWLLLEFVEHGSPSADYWEWLGRDLARLHRRRLEPYGWGRPNYIGSLPQSNDQTENWADFWWSRRLLPQLRRADEGRRLPGRWPEWERLHEGLEHALSTDDHGASLLHGDLWSGNVFAGPTGRPTLVDPAVYRGHAEVDLAMTDLFGGFPEAFYAAYEAVRPVCDGYAELRRPVYQLYPLLVHVNLFGGSYVDAAYRMLQRVLRRI